MTVNSIRLEHSLAEDVPPPTLTLDHLTFDPLHVLRCDPRVFRSVTFFWLVVRAVNLVYLTLKMSASDANRSVYA